MNCGIDFYPAETSIGRWVEKQDEEAKRRETERDRETENRRARVDAAKAPGVWSKVVDQVNADVEELRRTFPGDPSRDFQFLHREGGFIVRSSGFPHISIEAFWVEDIRGVQVIIHT